MKTAAAKAIPQRLAASAGRLALAGILAAAMAGGGAGAQSLRGFERVAANAALELWADGAAGRIAVRSLKDGTVWTSTPPEWESDQIAAGSVKMAMASTLSIRYADDLGMVQLGNSYTSVVMREKLEIEPIENGIRFKHYFFREGLTIPVDFILGPDRLDVEVPIAKVRKDEIPAGSNIQSFDLNTLTLLPYFGAAGSAEKGYILVPDGCGAIIRFSNRRTDAGFSEPVYGRDPSINTAYKKQNVETLDLPVFGMDREASGGYLAVISSGGSRAYINAETAFQRSSYNAASATFIFKDSDAISVNDRFNQQRTIRLLEKRPSGIEKFAVSYLFLPKGKSGYPEMAARYRRYLQESGLLRQSPDASRNSLYLELFGCAVKVKPVLGIPMEVVQDYTRFKDAAAIISEFSGAGVRDMVLRYQSWNSGGIKRALPLAARPEAALGGKSGFLSLMKAAKAAGATLYPDADFLSMYRSNLGTIKELSASRSVLRFPISLRDYRMSTFVKEDQRPAWSLLRPKELPGVVAGFMRGFKGLGAAGLAPSSLGNLVYSDFGTTDRGRAAEERVALLDGLAQRAGGLLFKAPMAYALKSADHAMDIPAYSSRFDIEDEEVPFYQMTIRGSIPYTMIAGNVHPDISEWKLKLLETGSQPSFLFAYRNAQELIATDFDYLYSVDYRQWKDEALAAWKELSPTLERVKGAGLSGHSILSRDVRLSIYGNGVRIAVNYGREDFRVEGGGTVKAGGYVVWEGMAP
jgi:hypothetical protein